MSLWPYLVRARSLTGFSELVRSHGGDPQVLLHAEGLSLGLLDTPDETFPLAALAQVMARAARTLEVPDFGVRMAAHQDVSVLGAIALVALNSDTVAQALDGIRRNMAYHSPGLLSDIRVEGSLARLHVWHDVRLPDDAKRHLAEHAMFNTLGIVRALSQQAGGDWSVRFDHAPGFPLARYGEAFACAVSFGQAQDEICMPASVLAIRIPSASPQLRQAAENYVRSVLNRHPLDIARQVEDLVSRQLGMGRISLPVIASQLAISGQTLQRRLAERNACFEDIVDAIRRRRAEELLPLANLPIQRIADSLGYTTHTSFTRSCRRWFGEAPLARRLRLRRGADIAATAALAQGPK